MWLYIVLTSFAFGQFCYSYNQTLCRACGLPPFLCFADWYPAFLPPSLSTYTTMSAWVPPPFLCVTLALLRALFLYRSTDNRLQGCGQRCISLQHLSASLAADDCRTAASSLVRPRFYWPTGNLWLRSTLRVSATILNMLVAGTRRQTWRPLSGRRPIDPPGLQWQSLIELAGNMVAGNVAFFCNVVGAGS